MWLAMVETAIRGIREEMDIAPDAFPKVTVEWPDGRSPAQEPEIPTREEAAAEIAAAEGEDMPEPPPRKAKEARPDGPLGPKEWDGYKWLCCRSHSFKRHRLACRLDDAAKWWRCSEMGHVFTSRQSKLDVTCPECGSVHVVEAKRPVIGTIGSETPQEAP